MSDRIDSMWQDDSAAASYLDDIRQGIPFADDQIAVMLYIIEKAGLEVGRFLDLGSGDGALAVAVLKRFPEAEAVLVDFSAMMLGRARERLDGRHEFIEADLGDPGWASAIKPPPAVDLVVSRLAIHHQPDERKREIYREIFNLLKPGGFFFNLERVSPASPWLAEVFNDYFVDNLRGLVDPGIPAADWQRIESDYRDRVSRESNILSPVEDQCRWLTDCGFIDVGCHFRVFELALFGGRKP